VLVADSGLFINELLVERLLKLALESSVNFTDFELVKFDNDEGVVEELEENVDRHDRQLRRNAELLLIRFKLLPVLLCESSLRAMGAVVMVLVVKGVGVLFVVRSEFRLSSFFVRFGDEEEHTSICSSSFSMSSSESVLDDLL
jgi:hypothetical protein